jgi:hypothetical protein
MNQPKSYDGNSVVVHSVAAGQGLSEIANIYGLSDWHSIWLYNTRIRRVYLGDDPDVIQIGQQLYIPRSRAGYDNLIKKFRQLKVDAEIQGHQELGRIEKLGYQQKAAAELFDFAADALTVVVTFAAKSVKAARAAKVASETVGQGRIAAQYLADNEAKAVGKWLGDELKGKARGAFAKKADQLHEQYTGKETSVGEKTNKHLTNTKKAVEAMRSFSMQGGKFALNIAEIALDYMSPSKLANVYLKLATGETVEDTFKSSAAQVKAAVTRTAGMLDEKIAEYEAEREIVHPQGGSQVGRYLHMPAMTFQIGN